MKKIRIWLMRKKAAYYHKRIITYFKRYGNFSCKKVIIWDEHMKHYLKLLSLEEKDLPCSHKLI